MLPDVSPWAQWGLFGAIIAVLLFFFGFIIYAAYKYLLRIQAEHRTERSDVRKEHSTERDKWRETHERSMEKLGEALSNSIKQMKNQGE